jgi:acetyl-CoA synthetase
LPFTRALDDSDAPNYRWFTDGRLNASVNCLDVHPARARRQDRGHLRGAAGDTRRLSYRELHAECAASPTR